MAKPKKTLYCKRCGVKVKGKLKIQLTSARAIEVCPECWSWSMGKTIAEIRKDYKERARRKNK